MVNGEWRMLAPGERCLVQRGVPHLFRNGHEAETLLPPNSRQPDSFFASSSTCLSTRQTILNGMMKGVSLLWCFGL